MSHFTVLGAKGFIGSRLAQSLESAGHQVDTPARDADLWHKDLGIVFYAIGVTHDFRTRPLDTVAAHVSRLSELLTRGRFDTLVYLSSTRVYQGLAGTVDETSDLVVNPTRPSDLYNLSKLTGECVALACGRPVRIVRLSNVYDATDDSDAFLPSVMRAAVERGQVTLQTGPHSTRDYVSLADVVAVLPQIALAGRHWVYNLASGTNVTHADVLGKLAQQTPCEVRYAAGAVTSMSPRISISRLQGEFGFRPAALLDDLPGLVEAHRARWEPATC